MRLGDYPTSGSTKVYIEGNWIDDSLRIDFEEHNAKVPLWGYHQKHYADVADGKVLISGVLMINFRFPGYLMYAIGNILRTRQADEVSREVTPAVQGSSNEIPGQGAGTQGAKAFDSGRGYTAVISTIEQMRLMTPQQRAEVLMQMNDEDFTRTSSILSAMLTPQGPDQKINSSFGEWVQESPAEMSPHKFVGGAKGFDITVRYGTFENRTGEGVSIREVIEGVHLTGRRKVISAMTSSGDLGTSGSALVEVYPFFARRIQQYAGVEDLFPSDDREERLKGLASSVPGRDTLA